jgi:hypothetical protein
LEALPTSLFRFSSSLVLTTDDIVNALPVFQFRILYVPAFSHPNMKIYNIVILHAGHHLRACRKSFRCSGGRNVHYLRQSARRAFAIHIVVSRQYHPNKYLNNYCEATLCPRCRSATGIISGIRCDLGGWCLFCWSLGIVDHVVGPNTCGKN